MKKVRHAKKSLSRIKNFLKKNPSLNEALRVFDISYDQYQKAMNNVFFYNSASTSSINASKHK